MNYILIFILEHALEFMCLFYSNEMPNFSRIQIFTQILFCSLLWLCPLHKPTSLRFLTFPASKHLLVNCTPLDVHGQWQYLPFAHFHLHGSTGWEVLPPPLAHITNSLKFLHFFFSSSLMKIKSNCPEMWMCNPTCKFQWGLNHHFGRCRYLCCT